MSGLVLRFYTADRRRIENWVDGLVEKTPEIRAWVFDLARASRHGIVIEGQPEMTPVYDALLVFVEPQDLSTFLSRQDWRTEYAAVCW